MKKRSGQITFVYDHGDLVGVHHCVTDKQRKKWCKTRPFAFVTLEIVDDEILMTKVKNCCELMDDDLLISASFKMLQVLLFVGVQPFAQIVVGDCSDCDCYGQYVGQIMETACLSILCGHRRAIEDVLSEADCQLSLLAGH